MDSKNIEEIIKKFIENASYKAILIDGPWGCGKTHTINEYIKNNKKNKKNRLYYLSLFGLESIDEINTALYQETRKSHYKIGKIIKKEVIVLSKVVKAIPKVANLSDALEYQLGSSTPNEKIKEKTLIIFDDLERLSNKVSYSDLLGYINSLFLSNCRFICLMSTENINSLERKKDFDDFKEKVFDSVYKINETNHEIFMDIYNEYDFKSNIEIYDLFENNIRLAKKTELFYKEVLDRFACKNVDLNDVGINNSMLFKACIYAIKLALTNFEEYKPSSKTEQIKYDISITHYGKEIANGLFYLKNDENSKTNFSLPMFQEIVLSLLNIFWFNDYKDFDSIMFSTLNDKYKNSILSKEFYYLSDDNKKKYIKEFEKIINTKDFEWDANFINKLRSILHYSKYSFSNEQIKILAEEIAKKECDGNYNFKFELGFFGEKEMSDKNKEFLKKLETKIFELKQNNYISDFKENLEKNNYHELTQILYKLGKCDTEDKKEVLDYILENNFFMPDLSGDIDYDIWTYCHEMAKFAKNNNADDKFIEYANKVCKDSNIECLIDRYQALIYYNIDKTTILESSKQTVLCNNS